MCVDAGPPPEFIEAVGFTGNPKEASFNKVRRSALSENCYEGLTVRVVRPTEGMPEPQRQQAVSRAISYVQRQLGKPYDFSLNNREISQAYYCSNLVYFAYTAADGAGIEMPIDKSVDRDSFLTAIDAVANALDPVDRRALSARAVAVIPPGTAPSPRAIADFLVDDVFPQCRTTKGLLRTPAAQAAFKKVVVKVMEGQGFERYRAELARMGQEEKAGRYKTPVLGFLRRQRANLRAAWALRTDFKTMLDESGLQKREALKAARKVVGAVLPYSEILSAALFGVKDARTQALGGFLDKMDWLNGHVLSFKPLRWIGLGQLPGRAHPGIKTDFISPSDIAWAPMAHYDFNVKPEHPLDRAP